MFSKNFNVFVELFLYMLGSFVMMIDVLVVCSLHSKFLQVWVFWCCWPQLWQHCCPLQCLAMWLNYWQYNNTWLLVFCIYVLHYCVFPKRSIASWMYFFAGSVVCHKLYRWLGVDVDLQMRKIFELLYCLLISRCNLLLPPLIFSGSRFLWLFYFCLFWRVVWRKSFLDTFFQCYSLCLLYLLLNVSVRLCLLL